MKLRVAKLSSAVRLALSLGAVIAAGASGAAFAQDQSAQPPSNTNPATPQKASTLQTVVVTGSHIRRVDLETASPVVTIDRAAIKASGKSNLDLPDPDDEPFLEVALAASADFLVTGNLADYPPDKRRGCNVISPAAFMAEWQRRAGN